MTSFIVTPRKLHTAAPESERPSRPYSEYTDISLKGGYSPSRRGPTIALLLMMDDVHADQDWIDGNQDQDRTGNDVLKASLVVCKIQESRIKMGHLAGRRR